VCRVGVGPDAYNVCVCVCRVIKYYAWERNFSDAIVAVRTKEVEILTSQAYWRYVSV
jgi:hypothetical protein